MEKITQKPVRVSPLIKGARYSLLILGFYYGVTRKSFLTVYESKERPRRKKLREEELEQRKINGQKEFEESYRKLAKEIDVLPPEWKL